MPLSAQPLPGRVVVEADRVQRVGPGCYQRSETLDRAVQPVPGGSTPISRPEPEATRNAADGLDGDQCSAQLSRSVI